MNNSLWFLFLRTFAYMLGVAGVVYLIALEGFQQGTASKYTEESLTEWLESGTALVSAMFFALVARVSRLLRPATLMLAALCAMMVIREADFLLDRVFDGAWQMLVLGVLIAITIYLWRETQSIRASVMAFAALPSAGIFLSGFLVLLVFSRLFGREVFWQSVMGEGYMRVVKNIAEEGTEIMGYALIAISAVELLISLGLKKHGSERLGA